MSQSVSRKDRIALRRMLLLLSIGLFLLISVYIFVIAPLYIQFSNDVLYMGTVLPEVFSVLLSTVDVLVFGLFYGVLLYALYRFGLKKALFTSFVFIVSVLYKYIGNLLMTFLTDGVPTDGILSDVLNIGLYILLELLQATVVFTISALILRKAKDRERIRLEAAEKAKKVYEPAAEYLPFSRLLNFGNPLQKAAFWMAFVPMIVHVIQRAFYDIVLTIANGFYGNPLIDILWMILYYILDVVAYGVVVYFIEILTVSKLGEIEHCRLKQLPDDERNELFEA